jgi:hypothetical protein
MGFKSHAPGDFNSAGIGFVGDDDCDASVRDLSRRYVLSDGFEVRTASGEEDAEIFH